MDIIASPSTVIPLLLLLILIIYYLLSLTGALREANQDLKNQLRRERQEERRKMLQRVVNAKLDDSGGNNAIDRWRKVLEASSPVTPNAPGQPSEPDEEKIKARREFLARIMKKALRKSSNTSEDESHVGDDDDGDETDTEQHEPLPHDQDTATVEKRTPTRRKRSSVHMVDDRKAENTQHTQLQQPQQQQRKLSFTRMRDIVEIPRRKAAEQAADVIKPSVIVEKKERDKEKCTTKSTKPMEKSKPHDDDYNKVNVVSERRALRRQQNARESEGSLSQQTSLQDSANYDVVNEKNKSTDKQHATIQPSKSAPQPTISTSPDIFKFDSGGSIAGDATVGGGGGAATAAAVGAGSGSRLREYSTSRDNDESDTDQTSYKEIAPDSITSGKAKGQLSKDSSGSLSKNASTTSFQIPSPKGRGTNNNSSSNVSTPRGSIDHRKDGKDKHQPEQQHSPSLSPSPSEKLKQNSDDILNKPIRKLNSFLALVREAVAAKKQEQTQSKEKKEDGESGASSNPDLQSRVKAYIDDSTSVSMTESVKTTTETTSTTSSSKNTTYFESIRRKRHQEPPKPKRQDSNASIWSENIPVITISKSESNECILERDNDELNESSDNKSTKHAHVRAKKNT